MPYGPEREDDVYSAGSRWSIFWETSASPGANGPERRHLNELRYIWVRKMRILFIELWWRLLRQSFASAYPPVLKQSLRRTLLPTQRELSFRMDSSVFIFRYFPICLTPTSNASSSPLVLMAFAYAQVYYAILPATNFPHSLINLLKGQQANEVQA